MTSPQMDYDSPWKEALERFFEPFMALFFPAAHAAIDWARGYTFKDKELQRVVRDASLGRRWADHLAQVWLGDGSEAWVLIHIEVQGQVDAEFPRRMYTYNYRLFDRYNRRVASLAVLADDDPAWRPSEFSYTLFGCRASLAFPIVKLLDYMPRWDELAASRNPFAVVVMAHLKALTTHRDGAERLRWKLNLIRGLYDGGYSKADILELFRIIDWLMMLPEELTRSFDEAIERFEEERQMPYITSIERRGMERGMERGIQQGVQLGALQMAREALLDILGARFGRVPPTTATAIRGDDNLARLKELLRHAATIGSPEEFEQMLAGKTPA